MAKNQKRISSCVQKRSPKYPFFGGKKQDVWNPTSRKEKQIPWIHRIHHLELLQLNQWWGLRPSFPQVCCTCVGAQTISVAEAPNSLKSFHVAFCWFVNIIMTLFFRKSRGDIPFSSNVGVLRARTHRDTYIFCFSIIVLARFSSFI